MGMWAFGFNGLSLLSNLHCAGIVRGEVWNCRFFVYGLGLDVSQEIFSISL